LPNRLKTRLTLPETALFYSTLNAIVATYDTRLQLVFAVPLV